MKCILAGVIQDSKSEAGISIEVLPAVSALNQTSPLMTFTEGDLQHEDDRLVLVEYSSEDVPVLVMARRSKQTQELLGLPACMVKTNICHDRGCHHREDCTVHFNYVKMVLARAG